MSENEGFLVYAGDYDTSVASLNIVGLHPSLLFTLVMIYHTVAQNAPLLISDFFSLWYGIIFMSMERLYHI